MKKKIAFFTSHIHWNPHYETELELIQLSLDEDNTVYQVSCNGEWGICDVNLFYSPELCMSCISKRKMGLKLIEGRVKHISYSDIYSHKEFQPKFKFYEQEFNKINSCEELKEYKIDNFDIGMAVLSSFISSTRMSNPIFEENKNMLKKYFISTVYTYFASLVFFEKFKLESIYIFNGRFAHPRAIFRAAQKMAITCKIHERGSSKNKYYIYEDKLPHNISYFIYRVEQFWKQEIKTTEEKEKIAHEFFSARRKGKETIWHSFTSHQHNYLPYKWDKAKKNIVIFNSSEDEFQAIGDEWKFSLFENQLQGIKYIKEVIENRKDFHVYLRIHPNLSKVELKELKEIFLLESERFTLIPPQSPVDSYLLMENAWKVITFGSTIGLEATFWDKISIMLGRSMYESLDVTHNPKNKNEVENLIFSEQLEVKPKLGAIKYGYYLSQFGIKFKYYSPVNLVNGNFKGVNIHQINSLINKNRRKQSILELFLSLRDKFYLFRKKNKLFFNEKRTS